VFVRVKIVVEFYLNENIRIDVLLEQNRKFTSSLQTRRTGTEPKRAGSGTRTYKILRTGTGTEFFI